MTCKDCLYYEVCPLGLAIKGSTGTCLKFKNKADFVEVVRCGGCKYWESKVFDPIIEHHIGECHCSHWENDYFWYETCETDFCSYGERSDT